jgi:hypothetical protein
MNLRPILIAGLSMLFGSCLALMAIWPNWAQAQPKGAGMPGQYQAVIRDGDLWLIDTSTGEGWELVSEHTGSSPYVWVWSQSKTIIRPKK